jgi:hypothetical protein
VQIAAGLLQDLDTSGIIDPSTGLPGNNDLMQVRRPVASVAPFA